MESLISIYHSPWGIWNSVASCDHLESGTRSPQNAGWGTGQRHDPSVIRFLGSNIQLLTDVWCTAYRYLLDVYIDIISLWSYDIPRDLRYQDNDDVETIYWTMSIRGVYVKSQEYINFTFLLQRQRWGLTSMLIVCCGPGIGSWRGRRWRVSDSRSVSRRTYR